MSPLVLEVNARCWLRELSDKVGQPVTLDRVPEVELESWRALGLTHIWLMGVWQSGPLARAQALASPQQRADFSEALPDWGQKDVAGSPYAIAEYQVLESLGGELGLETFWTRLKRFGLRLILDFVPNHMGLDSAWLASRPELFVQARPNAKGGFRQATSSGTRWLAHGKDPNFPAWADTAQLDYRRQETRSTMIGVLERLASRCDGVRCDMAMLMLNAVFSKTWSADDEAPPMPRGEFWAEAITNTRKLRPDFLFLAEAYWGLEPRLVKLGFDFAYDKELYDLLVWHNGSDVQQYLLNARPESLKTGAHFLENHDEPRIASLMDEAKHQAAALTILGLPGMRFLNDGQLTGRRKRVPVQLLRFPSEPVEPGIERLYKNLLETLKASALGAGQAEIITPRTAWPGNPTAQNFILIQWQPNEAGFDLVAVNYAPHRGQCFVPLRLPTLPATNWVVKDRTSAEEYVRADSELRARGLYLDLAPFGAHVFKFKPMD